ncbi:MAG: RNA polymerase sigma factor [Ignavibacteriae bacterium]|nr:RNA polymerase sigma factor [Ignavibacteriota bacterium]
MERKYSTLNDAELFQVFRGTPEEKNDAFAELYARHSQRVYVYCLRMSGNPDDANDLFQEAFTRFFHHDFSRAVVANILAYLLTSARNIHLNHRRTTSRWSPFEEDDMAGSTPPYEREELFNMVGSALDLLDEPYREAFILRFYQGLSYKDIAAITGDTVASLKVRVMRAKEQIRGILAPYIADVTKHT